jgi:hypothetical protein
MLIKKEVILDNSSAQRIKLIPKNQKGGDINKMKVDVTAKPVGYVEGTTPEPVSRLYRTSDMMSKAPTTNLVSVPKSTESVKGSLLSRAKEQYNATKDAKTKEHWMDVMNKVKSVQNPNNLRGDEEVNLYKQFHPSLNDFITNVGFGSAAQKRGISVSGPEVIPTDTTKSVGLLSRLKKGGKVETNETETKEKPKLSMKKGGKKWIQKATASIKKRGTEGKCTPITKPGCTGRAKALALTFKKMAHNRKK